MTLAIDNFKNAISATNLGMIDLNGQGGIEVHNNHRWLPNRYIPDPAKNQAVRDALFATLSADPAADADYIQSLKQRLLGSDEIRIQPLMRRELKQILDAHESMRKSNDAFEKLIAGPDAHLSARNGLGQIVDIVSSQATGAIKASQLGKLLMMSNPRLDDDDLTQLDADCRQLEERLGAAYALHGDALNTDSGNLAVRNATDALFTMEANLRQLVNSGKLELTQGMARLLDYLAARGSEILTVWSEAQVQSDALQHGVTLRDLIAGKAAVMHGNAQYVQHLADRTADLESRLTAIQERAAANDRTGISTEECQALQAEFVALRNAMQSGEERPAEQTLAIGLFRRITVAIADLDKILHVSLREQAVGLIDSILPQQKNVDSIEQRCREELLTILKPDGRLNYNRLETVRKRIVSFEVVSNKMLNNLFIRLNELQNRLSGPQAQTMRPEPALIARLVKGEIGVGSAVGAFAHGFSADTVDPQIDDRFLVEEKRLGSGAVNTVSQLTYRLPGGEEKVRVFKAEEPARGGMKHLLLGATGYNQSNRIAEINRATRSCAEALGIENIAVRATVGVHNGVIGFFMEKAAGEEAKHAALKIDSEFHIAPYLKKATHDRAEAKAQYLQHAGSLARELCKMEWLDWLTGQMDRHESNYLVGVNSDGKATVTAIDNDGSFADYRVGLHKFVLNQWQVEDMLAGKTCMDEMKNLGMNIKKPMPIEKFDSVFGGNAILRKISENHYEIDMDRAGNPSIWSAVRDTLGVNNCAKPAWITRTIYTQLMKFKAQLAAQNGDHVQTDNINNIVRRMMPGNFSKEQITATGLRLHEMIDWADSLATQNKILDEDDWLQPETISRIFSEALSDDTGEIKWSRRNVMAGYLKRDFYDFMSMQSFVPTTLLQA